FQFVYPLFNDDPDLGWRMMFWICIVPALFTFWIRARVPESPVWLERRKQIAATSGTAAVREPHLSVGRIFHRDLIGT
ncbi:MFS transporter, partial [Nocardiopsis changdeensis]|uniref:MFS transporter n=1 Tax=Nocardiopsis changdeensis TaxID=2831969 RepID=UPI003F4798A0